jgi:hypothetical protein
MAGTPITNSVITISRAVISSARTRMSHGVISCFIQEPEMHVVFDGHYIAYKPSNVGAAYVL